MVRWWYTALVAVVAVCGACQFDTAGLPGGGDDDDDDDSGSVDAATGPDAPVDSVDAGRVDAASQPDARLACSDGDGDSFEAKGWIDAMCAEPLDCDDDDRDAFPGQVDFFDVEAVSGGYDYNCDGVEEKLDESVGEVCQSDWWDCVGTGWLGGVPPCGVEGMWHRCEDDGGCRETELLVVKMPCR